MTDSDHAFVRGICVGIAGTAVAIHLWLAVQFMDAQLMYADFAAALPTTTLVVTSPLWLWGLPALGAVAVAALVHRRPRSLLIHAFIAALLLILAIATWHWTQAPLHEINHAIR